MCTPTYNMFTVRISSSTETEEMAEIKTRDRPESSHSKLAITPATFVHGSAGLKGHKLAHALLIKTYTVYICLLNISTM